MNDFAKRWVEALRSGKYKQCIGHLHRNNRFCVMGVACDLMRNELVTELETYDLIEGEVIERFDGFTKTLPHKVMSKLGFKSGDYRGGFKTEKGEDNLMRLNDSGLPFTKLADLIEQHQGELFSE